MPRKLGTILGKHEIIILSIVVGLAAYVIDAAVDTFIFHDGPFLSVLIFAVPFGELCIRLYIFASFVTFGIFISRMLAKHKKTEETLRESEEKFRTLMEEAPVGILNADLTGKITYVNKIFQEDTGYSREEIVGKNGFKFGIMADETSKLFKRRMKEILMGKPSRLVEGRFKRKDGEWILAEVESRVIKKFGVPVGFQLTTRDITERKQMEKKLEEYSQHLEELVEKRTRELKDAQEQLLKAERLATIGEVAAMVGHDLRNPLTGIASAAYYLRLKIGSNMGNKAKEMLDIIDKDIEYSNKIVNDLLEYSRKITLELTENNPKSLLKEALALVNIPANVQTLDLTEDKPKIKVDEDKMKRVFVNIIKNSVEAMPEGGKLTIKSKETKGKVEIAFTDTGAGIPKEALEKLFVPLFTTKARGMGFGLSICKRVVEAHGGEISVESTAGKGTTFTLIIPIEPTLEGGDKLCRNEPEFLLLTTMKA